MVATGRPRTASRLSRRPVAWSVTLTALIIGVVPVLVLGVTAGITQQRALSADLANELGTLAEVQAARLALIGRAATSNAQLVASRTQLRLDVAAVLAGDDTVRERIDAILFDARDASDDLQLVAVTDPSGRVIASTDARSFGTDLPAPIPTELARRATQHREQVISAIVPGPDGPRWLLAAALVLDDEVIGAAVTETDLAPVRELTATLSPEPVCTATNVVYRDADGEAAFLIAPTPQARPGSPCDAGGRASTAPVELGVAPIPGPAAALALDAPPQLLRDTTDHLGRRVVAATYGVPELDLAVVVTATHNALLAPVRAAAQLIGLAVASAVLLAVVLAAVLSRRLSRPLRELQQVAVAVGSGARDARADPDATGELGELATAVNEMTLAVHAHEQALEDRYADLEVLTHAMAHDLKGPLTGIHGALELLATGRVASAEQARELTDMALAASERMQRLIADLLALVRALGAPRVREPVALGELVARAARDLGISDLVHHDGLPVVAGDAVLLEQLLQNLLANAATYVAPGVTPRIEISAVAPDATTVELRVDDNGVGIPPEERDRVLEPFVRGDAGRELQPGSGLGLSIVARVAEQHEGTVTIDASPLGGSRIAVTLPAAG